MRSVVKVHTAATAAILLVAGNLSAQTVTVDAESDFMTSGFFFASSADFVRGDEDPSSRASNRVTSPLAFGVTGETAYFTFDFDPSIFAGPIQQATFQAESVGTGFFDDPSPTNPAVISVHSLTADPLASINDTDNTGSDSFIAYRDAQITTSSIVSTATITGLGAVTWDITSLVNEWILNGDSNFAYALGTGALLDPDANTAAAFANSTFPGTASPSISIVIPEPSSALIALAAAPAICWRRRRLA